MLWQKQLIIVWWIILLSNQLLFHSIGNNCLGILMEKKHNYDVKHKYDTHIAQKPGWDTSEYIFGISFLSLL